MIYIIKGFQIIVFIFIVISTAFWSICRPAIIESMGITCSDSVNHNRVQVLKIPLLLLTCCQDWTYNLQIIVSLES